MAETVGFNLSKISMYEGKTKDDSKFTFYKTGTEAKDQVYSFIYKIIKPIKWKIKSKKIEESLNENGMSLKDVFTYERPRRDYTQERAIYLKMLYEKLGNLNEVRNYLINQGEPPIKKETISRYISQFLNNQGKSYETWKALNSGITIDKRVVGEIRVPLEVKKVICRFIFNIFLESCLNVEDDEIINKLRYFIRESRMSRIAFLLRDDETEDIILNFFESSIYLVRVVINSPEIRNSPTNIRKLIKEKFNNDLPYHDSHIKELGIYLFE